jgi:hypothetical protein
VVIIPVHRGQEDALVVGALSGVDQHDWEVIRAKVSAWSKP